MREREREREREKEIKTDRQIDTMWEVAVHSVNKNRYQIANNSNCLYSHNYL